MLLTALLQIPDETLADGDLAGWITCPLTGEGASVSSCAELVAFLLRQAEAARAQTEPRTVGNRR